MPNNVITTGERLPYSLTKARLTHPVMRSALATAAKVLTRGAHDRTPVVVYKADIEGN